MTLAGYRIAAAEAHDLPGLPELERASGSLFLAYGISQDVVDQVTDEADLAVARAEGRLFVAHAPRGSLAGFAISEHLDGEAHLAELGVHPDHGRRGLGRALVDRVADWARERGARYMTLTTYRDIPFNAPFYARLGFGALGPAEIGPELSERIQEEAAEGLDPDERVAMRLLL